MVLRAGIGSPVKGTLFIRETRRILQETGNTEGTPYTMIGRINDHKEGKNVEGVTLPSQSVNTTDLKFFMLIMMNTGFLWNQA